MCPKRSPRCLLAPRQGALRTGCASRRTTNPPMIIPVATQRVITACIRWTRPLELFFPLFAITDPMADDNYNWLAVAMVWEMFLLPRTRKCPTNGRISFSRVCFPGYARELLFLGSSSRELIRVAQFRQQVERSKGVSDGGAARLHQASRSRLFVVSFSRRPLQLHEQLLPSGGRRRARWLVGARMSHP